MTRKLGLPILLVLGSLAVGCNRSKPAGGNTPPPEVQVAYPVTRPITDTEEFPGWVDAINTVQVTARAQGYLVEVDFVDGQMVTEGDVLAIIQADSYEAAVKAAEAQVAVNQAALNIARITLTRAEQAGSGVSAIELDQNRAAVMQNEANVKLAQANLATAQINLNYTRILAPIGGRISRRMVDPGNKVMSDTTVLTSIVSVNPVYAYFDIDERTMQRLDRESQKSGTADLSAYQRRPPTSWAFGIPFRARENNLPWKMVRPAANGRPVAVAPAYNKRTVPVGPPVPKGSAIALNLGLADEPGKFPHSGSVDFVDNMINRQTGTLRVRGVFSNPDGLLTPGSFCRIQVPIGKPHDSILIADKALGTDQGRKFIYVLDADNKAIQHDVKIGPMIDGLRVVEGVLPTERVVTSGLQRIRAGSKVEPVLKDMVPEKTPGADPKLLTNQVGAKPPGK